MAEHLRNLFSRSASRDYSQLPTHEPFDGHKRSQSVSVVDYSNLRHSATATLIDQAEDLQMAPQNTAGRRQTVQIGAVCRTSTMAYFDDELDEEHLDEEAAPVPEEALEEAEEEVLPDNPMSCSRFVENSWFQAFSAVVIISNVITTIVEMDKPETKKLFFVPDQVMLGFYVVELCLRAHYFGVLFLCGRCKTVCWNVLDIIVVVGGVLDQWLMPVLPIGEDSGTVSKVLQLLRLLRLLRVFKIVRVFLDIDLSWTEAPAFQSFIGLVILINSLLMGMEIDIPWYGWFYFEHVLLCIYAFELSIRLKNFGTFFFSCDNGDIVWNTLDFIIVSSSILDSWITPLCTMIMKNLSFADPGSADTESQKKHHGMSLGKVMMLMRMFRLMRILRLAKLVKSVRPLFILVTGIMAALQGVAWVLVLTIGTLYAMGILATSLIGKKMAFSPGQPVPEDILKPFSTVPNSMFTLFRVMSGAASDQEQMAIDHLMEECPSIKLGFVFFMITSAWTLLSILTAVVSENMISTTGMMEQEDSIANAEEDHSEHVLKLKEVFKDIDTAGDGQVQPNDIVTFLSDKGNAVRTARRCRVPVRDIREVLQTVAEAYGGGKISLEKFVEYLADVSKVATEKSMMKMEAKLNNLSKGQADDMELLQNTINSWQEKSNNFVASKLQMQTEVCSRAVQDKAEALHKGQLQEVQRLMQGLAGKTEARLNEIQQKSQELLDSITEALETTLSKLGVDKLSQMLERHLDRMQHELVASIRGQESGVTKLRDGQEAAAPVTKNLTSDEELASIHTAPTLKGAAAPPDPIRREHAKEPAATNESHTSAACNQAESSAARIEESIRCLQQKTESMFSQNESLLEKVIKTVDQGSAALAVDKFSALESELRAMRQELLSSPARQSPDFSKNTKNTTKGVVETQAELAGVARVSGAQIEALAVQMEVRLLATESSIHGSQQKTEAMFRKIEGLLEKAVDQGAAAHAVDRVSEALQREFCVLRRELICSSGGQDPEVSTVRDELETGLASISAESGAAYPESPFFLTPSPVIAEGAEPPTLSLAGCSNGSSPRAAAERKV